MIVREYAPQRHWLYVAAEIYKFAKPKKDYDISREEWEQHLLGAPLPTEEGKGIVYEYDGSAVYIDQYHLILYGDVPEEVRRNIGPSVYTEPIREYTL